MLERGLLPLTLALADAQRRAMDRHIAGDVASSLCQRSFQIEGEAASCARLSSRMLWRWRTC
eukprot:COSAG06_NODE_3269_length_5588_cov_7.264711_6_plen_62_part_00